MVGGGGGLVGGYTLFTSYKKHSFSSAVHRWADLWLAIDGKRVSTLHLFYTIFYNNNK